MNDMRHPLQQQLLVILAQTQIVQAQVALHCHHLAEWVAAAAAAVTAACLCNLSV